MNKVKFAGKDLDNKNGLLPHLSEDGLCITNVSNDDIKFIMDKILELVDVMKKIEKRVYTLEIDIAAKYPK